jgi:uncharacterized protein (DUF2225 family)
MKLNIISYLLIWHNSCVLIYSLKTYLNVKMIKMKKIISAILLQLLFTGLVMATTWKTVVRECPVCKMKNNYQVIVSYGSYIYEWPSKFQLVFWPQTESQSVYCCPNCHFSAFIQDFKDIPESKIDTIEKVLQSIKIIKKIDYYEDIPTSTRLEIAEKMYRLLGYDDKEFWCRFYRVLGYHYDNENKKLKALQSRKQAVIFAHEMINDPAFIEKVQENLIILAAMNYFTGHHDSTLIYLEKAREMSEIDTENENLNNPDPYLDDLIIQYQEFMGESKRQSRIILNEY